MLATCRLRGLRHGMTTWIVVTFVLLIFFFRDCFLLRMGPARKTMARLSVYAAAILVSVIVLGTVTNSLTTDALLGEFWSLPATLSSLLFYGALLAICVWVRRNERHHLAWQIAAVPNPVLIGGLILLGRLMLPIGWSGASVFVAAVVAALWVGLVGLWVWRRRDTLMDVPELDFSIEFAGLVSSVTVAVSALGLILTGGLSGAAVGAWLP